MKCGIVVVLVAGLASVAAPPAGFAQTTAAPPTCGSTPTPTATVLAPRPARATLALDGESDELVTDASFGRETGTRLLTLVYDVTGCELAGTEAGPPPRPRIYPARSGTTIPKGVVELDGPPSIEGTSRYLVHLKVSSDAFDPGSYSGFVEIKTAWLNPVRTSITLSRSEDQFLIPAGWGAAGGLVGFLLFTLLRWFHDRDLLVKPLQLTVAGVMAVAVAAAVTYGTHYKDQDVWTSSSNGQAAFVVGLTASTSGVMAALLSAIWSAEPGAAKPERAIRSRARRPAARWRRRRAAAKGTDASSPTDPEG